MDWYIGVLKQYTVFTGRSRRTEYWMFFLFNFIIAFGIAFVEGLVGLPGTISIVYSLVVLVPGIAVAVRRLHDSGRSGWWLLIGLVPLIGFLVLIYFMVQDSQDGDNEYGHNPKAHAQA